MDSTDTGLFVVEIYRWYNESEIYKVKVYNYNKKEVMEYAANTSVNSVIDRDRYRDILALNINNIVENRNGDMLIKQGRDVYDRSKNKLLENVILYKDSKNKLVCIYSHTDGIHRWLDAKALLDKYNDTGSIIGLKKEVGRENKEYKDLKFDAYVLEKEANVNNGLKARFKFLDFDVYGEEGYLGFRYIKECMDGESIKIPKSIRYIDKGSFEVLKNSKLVDIEIDEENRVIDTSSFDDLYMNKVVFNVGYGKHKVIKHASKDRGGRGYLNLLVLKGSNGSVFDGDLLENVTISDVKIESITSLENCYNDFKVDYKDLKKVGIKDASFLFKIYLGEETEVDLRQLRGAVRINLVTSKDLDVVYFGKEVNDIGSSFLLVNEIYSDRSNKVCKVVFYGNLYDIGSNSSISYYTGNEIMDNIIIEGDVTKMQKNAFDRGGREKLNVYIKGEIGGEKGGITGYICENAFVNCNIDKVHIKENTVLYNKALVKSKVKDLNITERFGVYSNSIDKALFEKCMIERLTVREEDHDYMKYFKDCEVREIVRV